MPTSLGPAEILVILVVALLVLGPKRLPEAGRQVGRALAEVRKWSSSIQNEIRDVIESEPEKPSAAGSDPTKTGGDPVPLAPSPPAAAVPLAPPTQSVGEVPAAGDETAPPGSTAPTNGSTADPPRN